jgi:hypothetical protein
MLNEKKKKKNVRNERGKKCLKACEKKMLESEESLRKV